MLARTNLPSLLVKKYLHLIEYMANNKPLLVQNGKVKFEELHLTICNFELMI